MSALRGRFQEYRGVRVMPTFHPAFLLRRPERKRDTWNDLKLVIAELERLGVDSPRPSKSWFGQEICMRESGYSVARRAPARPAASEVRSWWRCARRIVGSGREWKAQKRCIVGSPETCKSG